MIVLTLKEAIGDTSVCFGLSQKVLRLSMVFSGGDAESIPSETFRIFSQRNAFGFCLIFQRFEFHLMRSLLIQQGAFQVVFPRARRTQFRH